METSIQARTIGSVAREMKATDIAVKSETVLDFWKKAEFYRFSIVPMLLIIVVCIGGIAAAITVDEHVIKLGVIVISCTLVETFILAVRSMKTILISSAIAVVLSLLMIII